MSNNLVNGFSDILATSSSLSNGNFRINQRGNFSSLTAVSVGDFVADCWYLHSNTIDYCEVKHNAAGYVQFSGYGKKGQSIQVRNKDTKAPGYLNMPVNSSKYEATTAAVSFYNSTGVPVTGGVLPAHESSGVSTKYLKLPVTKSGETNDMVRVMMTNQSTYNTPASFDLNLVADGEFSVYVHNFRIFNGGFRNPSANSVVNYADDLVRCKRYYQSGTYSATAILQSTGTNMRLNTAYNPFPVEMAGTPTISASWADISLYQSADAGTGTTSGDETTGQWTCVPNAVSSKGFRGWGNRDAGYVGDRNHAVVSMSWTATV